MAMSIPAELPISLEALLTAGVVEQARVEYKTGVDEQTRSAILRTVCAYANDLLNLGGGYIIIGVADAEGRPVLPPKGLPPERLDTAWKEIYGDCKAIFPDYIPRPFHPVYDDRHLLVLWCPAGDNRPYEAPEKVRERDSPRHYWVRRGSLTVKAGPEVRRQLQELTAKIPFDDRRSLVARIEDLSEDLIRSFLHDVRSDLGRNGDTLPKIELLRRMHLLVRANAHEEPRNAAVLFFTRDPDVFFRGARIEVVQFSAHQDVLEERVFRGPLHEQVRACLQYLAGLGAELVEKVDRQAEARRTLPYPYGAIEEALVNAIYHRSYEIAAEPTKVYLYPDRMEIISYPGPVAPILAEHLQEPAQVPPAPARNRRVGEFLKELRLAEARGTGIPKIRRRMVENGSPGVVFDFDEGRSYFRVILPVHPEYQSLLARRESAFLWTTGHQAEAAGLLRDSWERHLDSAALAGQLIDYLFELDDQAAALDVLERYTAAAGPTAGAGPYQVAARRLLERGALGEAAALLRRSPAPAPGEEAEARAILLRRAGDLPAAHREFEAALASRPGNARTLHEFAQVKMALAGRTRGEQQVATRRRLYVEALDLLRQAVTLAEDRARRAWCYFDLARALLHLDAPESEVESARATARQLLPEEPRFRSRVQKTDKPLLSAEEVV